MNNSNVLYRIACDMSDSGLIKSESARGFFNTLDTLLTPKSEISASGVTKIRGRARRTINEVACDMGITSMKLLNFLALIGWIDNATVQPTTDSLTEGVLRKKQQDAVWFYNNQKG
ncbi:hypothetical protein LNO36_29720 [Klebsiella variicola subsp. variicola]|nr:hypothetical protein [Klebsiella variicola subsp. variicola]